MLKFRLDQESPIDPSASWTPVQGPDNWMQIGTQSEYIYGSFNRKCDDGICETHRFDVSAVTKKEVYCRGGTENSNHNFNLREILLLCQGNDDEENRIKQDMKEMLLFYGLYFACVFGFASFSGQWTIVPKTSSQTTVSCTGMSLPFISGYSSLPIHVEKQDFVDFTIPFSMPLSGTSTVRTVWFGLTRNKMTVAEGKCLCEKYPGLNVATTSLSSLPYPGFDRIRAMFRKYGKQREFCLKIESSTNSQLAMLTHDGKWNKGKVSENAEGFIICEVSMLC